MAIEVRIPCIELILAPWVTWSEVMGCFKEQMGWGDHPREAKHRTAAMGSSSLALQERRS